MSEPITAYTTTDAIRGAVGVTDNEITDSMLIDQRLDLELEADLLDWLPTHATIFAAGQAVAATATEKQTAAHVLLYAQWFCAAYIVNQMRLGLPAQISDGKSEMRRFTELDLDKIAERVEGSRDKHKAKILELEGGEAVTTASIMESGTPDYDPVSNV